MTENRNENQTSQWKGLEHEATYQPQVKFSRVNKKTKNAADMTPMVDVTFLLLIFFMVTASFTIHKSIDWPRSVTDESSKQFVNPQDSQDPVVIFIDQYNTYHLTSRDKEEVEAASDNEMRRQLRDMANNTDAKKLIIKHHGDAIHEKVVTAWDAGVRNQFQDIVTELTEFQIAANF